MDSAFYGRGPVRAALAGGAQVSVTVRTDARVKAAIASIAEDAWTMIQDATVFDASGQWVFQAEVADRVHRVRGQTEVRSGARWLIVHRIQLPGRSPAAGQDGLFDLWRSTRCSPPPTRRC